MKNKKLICVSDLNCLYIFCKATVDRMIYRMFYLLYNEDEPIKTQHDLSVRDEFLI